MAAGEGGLQPGAWSSRQIDTRHVSGRSPCPHLHATVVTVTLTEQTLDPWTQIPSSPLWRQDINRFEEEFLSDDAAASNH